MTYCVTIVDSHAKRASELKSHISDQLKFKVQIVSTGAELLAYLESEQSQLPDAILYDLAYRKEDLLNIAQIRQLAGEVPILALVSQATIDLGAEAITVGASDFLPSPFHSTQLTVALRRLLLMRDLQEEVLRLRAWNDGILNLDDLEANSDAMQATIYLAQSIADADFPILLEGAPGSGKEMFGRIIHASSSNYKGSPFYSLNLALLQPYEMESAIFGDGVQQGAIESAGNGTVFIRGAELLSPATRARLSRVIRSHDDSLKCRFMFAAHDAVHQLGKQHNEEMQDFYSEVSALPLAIPLLKDMKADIPQLANILARRYGAIEGRLITGLTNEAANFLQTHSWSGNIRELAHAVFYAVMQTKNIMLDAPDFIHLKNPNATPVAYLPMEPTSDTKASQAKTSGKPARGGKGMLSCLDDTGNIRRLEDVEMDIIRYALARYNGHMSDVAKHLGIGRSTLYRKLADEDEPKE